MLEAKITIDCPELANAINNLAAVIGGTKAAPAATSTPAVTLSPAPQQGANPIPTTPMAAPAPVTSNAPVVPPATTVPVAPPPQYTVDQTWPPERS